MSRRKPPFYSRLSFFWRLADAIPFRIKIIGMVLVITFVYSRDEGVIAHTFDGGFPADLLKITPDIKKGVWTKALQTNEGLSGSRLPL
ncbi:MAG: hypothetical protein ACUVQ6_03205 [Dissulfurimicrobium sp.]|uniref:hypothetical protein n=1 Tax=Dissulfurimicrobium sp. TaxID=2022436 RepID=UPI0040499CCE